MSFHRPLPHLVLLAFFVPALLSATPGSFRGIVVKGPEGESTDKVLYVEGRNGLVRRVDISSAVVLYDGAVPENHREKKPAKALKSGIEVRVTAEQGDSGEWKATQIEIVDPEAHQRHPVERERQAPIDEHTSVT